MIRRKQLLRQDPEIPRLNDTLPVIPTTLLPQTHLNKYFGKVRLPFCFVFAIGASLLNYSGTTTYHQEVEHCIYPCCKYW